MLAGLPSRCGQSVFFAAFKIAPCGGKFAKLASELDRLGVSEARARARGNTAWVEATYDPFGVTYTSPVLLMGEGQAWKDDPGAGKNIQAKFASSAISAVHACSGLDVESVSLPRGGRAPGWNAGIAIARRQPGSRQWDHAR